MTHYAPTVLLTRPLEDALRITPDFEDQGCHVLINPVMEIVPLPLKALPLPLEDIKALCITSRHALPALKDPLFKDLSRKIPVYCVGDQTAEDLAALGFTTLTSAPSARWLLRELKSTQSKNTPLLYLAGTVQTLDFHAELPGCQTLVCYDAKPTRTLLPEIKQALQQKIITHIPFYSSRSASLLKKLLTPFEVNLKEVTLCALSPEIAATLRDWDVKEIRIAAMPTHQALLDLLISEG